MRLSDISIKNPVFAWMLMLGLILFGWMSFQRMGISQLPDVDFPVLNVSVTYEGAAPEVMEADVADIIEDSLMTVQGIRSLTSVSRYGATNVTVEFELNREIDAALQEVQGKITQAAKRLPREIDPPMITKSNPDDQPILWLTLASTRHSKPEIMRFVRDQLKDKFSTVGGVGEVVFGGYVEPSLRVWISNQALNRLDLTVGDVLGTIQGEHAELPAGQLEDARRESDVRTLGEARSVEEFGQIVVTRRGNQPNYSVTPLKQVARIEEGTADVRRVSRFNGEPAVGLGIKKQRGANAVEVAKAVKAKMKAVSATLPAGMSLNVNFDTTRFIEQSIHGLNAALVLAALFTALVCWAFLGSWSSTFNVLMSIPTSIVGAFIGLHAFGFTLNTFTLLGLSLAIGIVVDDAIMVLENIVRHREMGKSRMEAACVGSREITFAALAATVAIVAIFLPVAFMRGVIGRFFFQFGITMTITVLLSLLEALTLTPMRCSRFVEAAERHTRLGRGLEVALESLAAYYRRLVARCLTYRYWVIAGSLLFFLLSTRTVSQLNKEFVPPQDQSVFIARLQTPVDASLSFTDEKSRVVEAHFRGLPEVSHVFAAVGGMAGGEVNTGIVFVSLKEIGSRGQDPKLGRERTQLEIMNAARAALKKTPDVRVSLQDLSMRGFSASRGFPVEFSIRGADWTKLGELSKLMTAELEKTGFVTDIDSDYKLGKPEIHVLPDRKKAAERGVSIRDISETVSAMVGGVSRGRYTMGGHRYDIRVRLEPSERDRLDQIKELYVRNNRGVLVRLSEVVRIETGSGLQQITRYDRDRAITMFANVKPGQSQAKALQAAEVLGKKLLPEGYRLVMSGSAKTFSESFQDLTLALVLGLLVAYMVLGSQFNSFIDPITVLMALPFSLSGAFIALWLWGVSLNIYSFIGLILLMGIVKKNSILLVEFTHQVRKERPELTVDAALVEACPVRLRPILMTSVATVAAAIPEAIQFGAGSETRIPMAVCVIGGVLVSTVLTLVVVPCVYSAFSEPVRGSSLRAWLKSVVFNGRRVGAVGGLLLASGLSVAEGSGKLGLISALALMDAENPTLKQLREAIQEREAQIRSLQARHFPTVQAVGSVLTRKDAANAAGSNFGGEPFNFYQGQLQANLPLFRGFEISGSQAAAASDLLRAHEDYELSRRTLALDLMAAYFSGLLQKARYEAFLERTKLDDELLRQARLRERIGKSPRIDVLQIESQLALFQPQIEQARTAIEVSHAQLQEILAQAGQAFPGFAGDLRVLSLKDVNPLLAAPEASQVSDREVLRAEAVQRQIDFSAQAAFARHLPTVDAVANFAQTSFDKTELTSRFATSWSAGVQVTIQLFSGLNFWSDRRMFAAQREQAEQGVAAARNRVALGKKVTAEAWSAAEKVLRTSEVAGLLSRKLLAEAQRNYGLSTIDYQQLLNIERDALLAELAWLQARHDLVLAAARWLVARSLPLEPLALQLDRSLAPGRSQANSPVHPDTRAAKDQS